MSVIDLSGRRLGRYRIEALIGSGGMGSVYDAVDSSLNRHVAVKILPVEVTADPQRLVRFTREAHAAATLNHPHAIAIYEVGSEQVEGHDVHYIAMEKVDGPTLRRELGNEPLPELRAIEIVSQVAEAVGAAHALGIVHRDLKPENIMISSNGYAKVLDFGLAKQSESEIGTDDGSTAIKSTAEGVILGTVGYMAPEQAMGRHSDARSDVFSLGCVLYECVSGVRPFRGSSSVETLNAIIHHDPPPVSQRRADVSPELERIIGTALAKNPEERYQNARDLAIELRALSRKLHDRAAAGRSLVRKPATIAVITTALLMLLAFGLFWWQRDARLRWVRNEALPEIERLFLAQDNDAAWRLARRAREIAPDDPQLAQMWSNLTIQTTIESDPPNARVEFKSYSKPDDPWTFLGTTPTPELDLPLAQLRFRVSRDGYVPVEAAPQLAPTVHFKLQPIGAVPERMVSVRGGSTRFLGRAVTVPDFLIDQFEVTNREFKTFVDAGGYERPELWKEPIVHAGRALSWPDGMKLMVDSTGRPGPAGWELGSYADGQGELPVDGISWYEAAAYAEFIGKKLPTVYHWMRAATDFTGFSDILTASNFESRGPVAVGSLHGIGPHGTYDMAGNVKEWCRNAVGEERFALGGAWFEPSYQFLSADSMSPSERKRGFGIRLIKETAPPSAELSAEVIRTPPQIPQPVDDATFQVYLRLYEYDPLPLDPKVDEVDDSNPSWKREKVSFTAAYGNERIPAYVYLPKNARPPYQTVVFFPGSHARMIKSSANPWMRLLDFYVKSGRAVIYPVYKGTYERQVEVTGPNARRELVIQQVKDVRRVVDYVTARPDLDSGRIAYYGVSWGLAQGALNLAVEQRFKVGVLLAGGLYSSSRDSAEVAIVNYLPRVKQPVLMVTGRYDFGAPYETSQKPFFDLLGAPPEDKRHVVLNGGHLPPQYTEIVREILAWTDARLGPVHR